jgi:hypothetical protein
MYLEEENKEFYRELKNLLQTEEFTNVLNISYINKTRQTKKVYMYDLKQKIKAKEEEYKYKYNIHIVTDVIAYLKEITDITSMDIDDSYSLQNDSRIVNELTVKEFKIQEKQQKEERIQQFKIKQMQELKRNKVLLLETAIFNGNAFLFISENIKEGILNLDDIFHALNIHITTTRLTKDKLILFIEELNKIDTALNDDNINNLLNTLNEVMEYYKKVKNKKDLLNVNIKEEKDILIFSNIVKKLIVKEAMTEDFIMILQKEYSIKIKEVKLKQRALLSKFKGKSPEDLINDLNSLKENSYMKNGVLEEKYDYFIENIYGKEVLSIVLNYT